MCRRIEDLGLAVSYAHYEFDEAYQRGLQGPQGDHGIIATVFRGIGSPDPAKAVFCPAVAQHQFQLTQRPDAYPYN
jgi:hypothetical protein